MTTFQTASEAFLNNTLRPSEHPATELEQLRKVLRFRASSPQAQPPSW
jgi:hypothetical protein